MFGDSDEDLQQETLLSEFDYATQDVLSQAPDLDTGLAALRDLYTEYDFQDAPYAQKLLEERSTELRQNFGKHTAFDFDETVEYAPVPLADVQLEDAPDSESKKRLALINKWEQDNIAELSTSNDPINVQNRSKYIRDIQKASTALRREVHGADNYVVDGNQLKYSPSWGSLAGDTALSAGQGLVGGAASLVGAESVNDWFEEGIDPGYQQNHPYLAGIASGAGTAVGAIAAGAATTLTTGTPVGAAAYLGVTGAGAARQQVEEALDTGATVSEAALAGGIEATSQAAQAFVGGKVFGKVAGQLLGKAAPTLGAKVFPKITGTALGRIGLSAGMEAVTEGAGQVASNVAKNIGQGTDVPLTEGVGVSMVAGGVLGAAATGTGETVEAVHSASDLNVDADMQSGFSDTGMYSGQEDLSTIVANTEGEPPPAREGVRVRTQPVDLTNPLTVIKNEDGSELAVEDGRLHIKNEGVALESHDENFFVSAETKAKLDQLPHARDGAAIHLSTRDGKLYIETANPYLNEDLTINDTGTGSSKVEVPTTAIGAVGSYHVGVTPAVSENGFRKFKYDVAESPVKEVSTAGAAHISDLKTKESQFIQKFRERYKDDPAMLEMAGLGFTDRGTGEFVETPVAQYMQTEKGANKQGFSMAEDYIEKNGFFKTLAYLDSLDRLNDQDVYISETLERKMRLGIVQALAKKNYAAAKAFRKLLPDVVAMKDKGRTIPGRSLQVAAASDLLGESEVARINTDLTDAAEKEMSAEEGRPVTLPELSEEAEKASADVKSIEAELAVDPIEKRLTELDVEDKADETTRQAEIKKAVEEQKAVVKKAKEKADTTKETKATERKAGVDAQTKEVTDAIAAQKDVAKKAKIKADRLKSEKRAEAEAKRAELKAKSEAAKKQLRDHIEKLKKARTDAEKTIKDLGDGAPKREAKSLNSQIAKINKEIEKAENSLKNAKDPDVKIPNLKHDKEVQKARKEAAKAQALVRKLTSAAKKKGITDPKTDARSLKFDRDVQKARKEAAKAQENIRRLTKAAKTKPEPNAKRAAERTRLTEKRKLAQESGAEGVRLNPEQRERYAKAKSDEQRARNLLARAEKKLQEKLSTFPQEAQDRLRTLYKLRDSALPSGKASIDDEILQITAKFSEPTRESVDNISAYWRRMLLSSVETAVRNSTTVLNAASTAASLGLGDIVRAVKSPVTGKPPVFTSALYLRKLVEGFREAGLPEAMEVMAGNRGGRLQLSADKPGEHLKVRSLQTPQNIRDIFSADTSPGKKVSKVLWTASMWSPLMDVATVMERVLSATDTAVNRTFSEGMAGVSAALLELHGKEVTPQAIDELLFTDAETKAEIKASVAKNAEALRSVGIKVSPRQEQLMVREAIEMKRSDTIRANADRHGLDNTFMGAPNHTVLGMIAHGITTAINHKFAVIPFTNFHPGRILLPFIPTAAKIGDMYIAHTPLGLARYAGMKFEQSLLRKENARGAAAAAKEGKSFTPKPDTFEIASQEQLGRVVLGSAAIGLLATALASQDDEDPWLAFYGLPSLEDRETWKAKGIQPFTLKIGSALINKEALGPLSLAFAMADNVAKAHKAGTDPAITAFNTVMLSLPVISELSFLPAVSDFFQMLQGSVNPISFEEGSAPSTAARVGNKVKSAVAGVAQGFIPSVGFLKNVYKWYAGDPQETYNNLQAKLANNIPVAREMVGAPSKLNEYGEPVKFDLSKRMPTGVLMSRYLEDDVASWRQKTGYKITPQGPTIKLNKGELKVWEEYRRSTGDKYPDTLSEMESRRVLEISGPEIKAYLASLIGDPRYSTFSEDRQKEINAEVAKIRARARQEVLGGL